jgi:poly(3-hydroxybutyrate) depolymerase
MSTPSTRAYEAWVAGGRSPGFRAYRPAPSQTHAEVQWRALAGCEGMRSASPVTVAGPRRFRTGFPFTTDQ